jgi:thymidine phosphorylase
VTGTVESVGLITASILSKKIAEGLDGLVMDMKVGTGAFLQTLAQAEELATSMQRVCREIGLPVTFVFTRMNRPLGKSIGNWVEVVEADAALAGLVQRDLAEVTTELVAQMIRLSDATISMDAARERVIEAWRSGRAHVIFHEMLARQGGDWSKSIAHYSLLPTQIIEADQNGVVDDIDARALAMILCQAGAGRMKEDDVIDPAVGAVLHEPPGSPVVSGQPLATIHASSASACAELATSVRAVLKTTTAPVEREPSMILQVWGADEQRSAT